MRKLLVFISLFIFLLIILPLNIIYFYLNYAPDQKKVLSQIASHVLKQPVQIERAHIQGWITNPVIVFDRIAIGSASQPLVLAHVEIHMAFWKSFLERKWIIDKIVLDHLRLQIIQTPTGNYQFGGLTPQALSTSGPGHFLGSFLSFSRQIILFQSTVSVCFQKKPCILVGDVNLRLKNLSNHSIQVIANLKNVAYQNRALPLVRVNAQWSAPFDVWGTIDIPSLQRLYGEFRLNAQNGVVQIGNQLGELISKWSVKNNQVQAITTIQSDLSDALKIAEKLPFSISRSLGMISGSGQVHCEIRARMNLKQFSQPTIQAASVHFENNTIAFPKWGFAVSQLNGNAKIINNQLQADKLTAFFGNQPILISLKEKKNQGIDLFLQGKINPASIADNMHLHFLKNWNQSVSFHAWMTLKNNMMALPVIHLTIDELNYLGQSWRNIYLDIMQEKAGWHLQIQASKIAGSVFFPSGMERSVEINLSHLTLLSGKVKNVNPASVVNPQKIPPISLRIHQLFLNNHNNGDLLLLTTKIPDGLLIQKFTLNSPFLNFSATGKWIDNNGLQQTAMQGVVKSKNLGVLLSQRKLSSRLQGGDFSSEFSLHWMGLPQQFSLSAATGYVAFTLQKGVIVQLDSDTQNNIILGRLFNLFTMETVSKLLTFNFSALTKNGFEFNEIQGRFNLKNGVLSTQHIDVDSNIAKIVLSGEMGLENQSNNLMMRVFPSISSSFSTVAGFVGGPVVGATTWVANKLFSHKIGEMTEKSYRITGTWEKPIIVEQAGGAPARDLGRQR